MLQRYVPHFASLAPEHARHVAEAVARRHSLPEVPDAGSGEELFRACQEVGLDQADVVMSLADDPTAMGVVCIETLIGRPITRPQPAAPGTVRPARAQRAPRGAAVRRTDGRTIVSVAPNPKRPGTAAHARYERYVVGETVEQAIARGVTADDVRYDEGRGYVVLALTPEGGSDA